MFQTNFLPTLRSLLVSKDTPLIHRDLSWLQFNERVLREARQTANPLYERLKFLSITASNLDEFFMIRFSSLNRALQRRARGAYENRELLLRVHSKICESVTEFGVRQAETLDNLAEELRKNNTYVVQLSRANKKLFSMGEELFRTEIAPHLQGVAKFRMKDLLQLENLQMGIIFDDRYFARIPKSLQPAYWIHSPERDSLYIFFLDDLIGTFLGPSLRVGGETKLLRLTRDGDFSVDLEHEDPESLPDEVRTKIRTREAGSPMRLQYIGEFSESFYERMLNTLRIKSEQAFLAPNTLCLNGLFSVMNKVTPLTSYRPRMTYKVHTPFLPPFFSDPKSVFEKLKERDILLHHPYDSFDAVVSFIESAVRDPDVVSIEQTVYRVDVLSPVVAALKKAAKRKRVRAIIELRARFDEMNNLRLAEDLSRAGVQVSFGYRDLKLHAKVVLVTRKEGKELRTYTHLSTGNYNSTTARHYTDLAIITANPLIGQDARTFFDSVIDGVLPKSFSQLVAAPGALHRRILTHIKSEMKAARQGLPARIVAKVNALVDEQIIEQLYEASMAGVQVDLVVRGACSLVPGVRGLSDRIRVVSIVDRFLEHSRIYYFENSKVMYLSSADWMPRNFFSRFELAFPVLDERIYQYLRDEVIPTYLIDTAKARELTPQGVWRERSALPGQTPLRSQFHFEILASREYRGTALDYENSQGNSEKGTEIEL